MQIHSCNTHSIENLVSHSVTLILADSHQPRWICKWDEQICARDYLTASSHGWWERETSLVLPLDFIITDLSADQQQPFLSFSLSSVLQVTPICTCFCPSCRSPPLAVLLPPSVCSGRGVAAQLWPTYANSRWSRERARVRLTVKSCFCSFFNSYGALNEHILCNYTHMHVRLCPPAFETDVLAIQRLSLSNKMTLDFLNACSTSVDFVFNGIRVRCSWRRNQAINAMSGAC